MNADVKEGEFFIMKGYGVYHLVKSPTKKYCYDGNKGKLFEIDEDVYSYLNDAGEWNDEVGQKIEQIRAQGFLLDPHIVRAMLLSTCLLIIAHTIKPEIPPPLLKQILRPRSGLILNKF